jgi:hypothetical protein
LGWHGKAANAEVQAALQLIYGKNADRARFAGRALRRFNDFGVIHSTLPEKAKSDAAGCRSSS